jgi:hypothetical protein
MNLDNLWCLYLYFAHLMLLFSVLKVWTVIFRHYFLNVFIHLIELLSQIWISTFLICFYHICVCSCHLSSSHTSRIGPSILILSSHLSLGLPSGLLNIIGIKVKQLQSQHAALNLCWLVIYTTHGPWCVIKLCDMHVAKWWKCSPNVISFTTIF